MKSTLNRASWRASDLERFESLIQRTETCWLWLGAIDRTGYGRFTFRGSNCFRAHRAAYILYVGEIPEGLVINHTCGVRHCVRPDHLEVTTPAHNAQWNSRARAAGLLPDRLPVAETPEYRRLYMRYYRARRDSGFQGTFQDWWIQQQEKRQGVKNAR